FFSNRMRLPNSSLFIPRKSWLFVKSSTRSLFLPLSDSMPCRHRNFCACSGLFVSPEMALYVDNEFCNSNTSLYLFLKNSSSFSCFALSWVCFPSTMFLSNGFCCTCKGILVSVWQGFHCQPYNEQMHFRAVPSGT